MWLLLTDLCVEENHLARDITVVVSEDLDDSYLSLQACKALGIVGPDFSRSMASSIQKDVGPVVDPSSSSPVWPLNKREDWIKTLPDVPSSMDFSTVEAKLKSIYREAFDDSCLKPMRGPTVGNPMVIALKDDARPFATNIAYQIPIPQLELVKANLKEMVTMMIIEEVGDVPTPWCHSLAVVPKSDGGIRLWVDWTRLNTEVIRSIHPTKTLVQAVQTGLMDEYRLRFIAQFIMTVSRGLVMIIVYFRSANFYVDKKQRKTE
ncbi:uncharacterized protein LOC131892559 [Tigriopus californicus]|uniref:uncharacterized protein LOC131892559 n=1 Tax=Tigriopus californicus TaxID=6832 RepID=UPI0027DA6C62|nr:uncharacterized protein LOC131892559 [Tigriopus californicus]